MFGLLLLAAVQASAFDHGTYINGNKLHEKCSAAGDEALAVAKRVSCIAYVDAVHDTHTSLVESGATPEFCVTRSVEAGQLYDVVKTFLADNPQYRHSSASSMVIYALGQAFPCRKK